MKLNKAKLLALATLFFSPALAWAGSGDPGTGLLSTAHDFTSNGLNDKGTDVGLCTYCHTPHKAISTLLLWNHTLSSNTFSWDATSTTAGTTFPKFAGGTYKGPTAKCLSCHDGSVAVGDVAWFAEASHTAGSSAGTLSDHKIGEPGLTEFLITKTQGSGDLSGNHPVAMPFPLGNTKNTYNGVTTGNAIVTGEWQSDPTGLKEANMRLFNDDGTGNITAGTVTGKTGIECSSCHDPHNKAAIDDLFLRGKLTGSKQSDGYICLQCHIK